MMSVDAFERVLSQPGTRALYESHYLKANAPDGSAAFWVKYCFLSPSDGSEPLAELWAVWWDRAAQPIVVKQTLPARLFERGTDSLKISWSNGALSTEKATGALDDGKHNIRWDLQITAPYAPLMHFPYAAMYTAPLPKSKMMTPAPGAHFEGTFTVDGEEHSLHEWVGLRGHNWGREHAHNYAYGNCSLWDEGPEGLHLDAFSAQVRLGPVVTPYLSAAMVVDPAGVTAFNHPKTLVTKHVELAFPRWWVLLEDGGRSLELAFQADPGAFAGLRYHHPNGGLSYCYNTKHAVLTVALRERSRGPIRARSHRAELEFLSRSPIPSIPLHGNATLEEVRS